MAMLYTYTSSRRLQYFTTIAMLCFPSSSKLWTIWLRPKKSVKWIASHGRFWILSIQQILLHMIFQQTTAATASEFSISGSMMRTSQMTFSSESEERALKAIEENKPTEIFIHGDEIFEADMTFGERKEVMQSAAEKYVQCGNVYFRK